MRSANVITALLCGMTLLCAQQAPPTYEFYAHFDTSMGEIVVRLFADRNPRTVANFIALAEGTIATLDSDGKMANKPFFNGLEFHRVIRNFMIQTGELPVVQDCGVPAI